VSIEKEESEEVEIDENGRKILEVGDLELELEVADIITAFKVAVLRR
jgi:hypothetical protein